jgi:hypothetical protein
VALTRSLPPGLLDSVLSNHSVFAARHAGRHQQGIFAGASLC